jgi:hypothetical protein
MVQYSFANLTCHLNQFIAALVAAPVLKFFTAVDRKEGFTTAVKAVIVFRAGSDCKRHWANAEAETVSKSNRD